MKKVFVLFLLFSLSACSVDKSDMSLKQSVVEMKQLIEQNNMKEFFETRMDPAIYNELKDDEEVQKMLTSGIPDNEKKEIIAAFDNVIQQLPEDDKNLKIDNGVVQIDIPNSPDMQFKKINGIWVFASR